MCMAVRVLPGTGGHMEHDLSRRIGEDMLDAVGGGALVTKQRVTGSSLHGVRRRVGGCAGMVDHAEERVQKWIEWWCRRPWRKDRP